MLGLKYFADTLEEAKEIQQVLKKYVVIDDFFLKRDIEFIAGADASYTKDGKFVFAAAVLFKYPQLLKLEEKIYKDKVSFPYIAGFLSFREAKSIIKAIGMLDRKPDVLIIDGHGIAHPEGLGLAGHVGVVLDIPSIGCAKSLLYGRYKYKELKECIFSQSFIYDDKDNVIGMLFRTKSYTKPVVISAGHKISLEKSRDIVMRCVGRYRIPIPLREAHIVSRKAVKLYEKN